MLRNDQIHPPVRHNDSQREPNGPSRVSSSLLIALVIIVIGVIAMAWVLNRANRSSTPVVNPPLLPPVQPTPIPSPQAAVRPQPLTRANPDQAPVPEPQAPRSAQALAAMQDVAIDKALNLKLLKDRSFEINPIDASSNNGWVILRGDIPNEALKRRAESIARSISGVKGVRNELTIKQ